MVLEAVVSALHGTHKLENVKVLIEFREKRATWTIQCQTTRETLEPD